MHVQMVTDLFQYEPCELRIRDRALYLKIRDEERAIAAQGLTGATLTRQRNGTCRMELATVGERFEFLLSGEHAADEAQKLLYQLTRNDERLELRMRAE